MNKEEKETVEELRKQLRLAINIDDVATTIRNDDAETILNLIEKLQKEKEELEEINNELEAEKNEAIRRYNFETIPIKKIKDKIEELKNISNTEELEDIMNRKNYTISELVQYILQELLAERKEN